MLRNCTRLLILAVILLSCNANKNSFPAFLSKDSLPSQIINIDNSKDTVIVTANGAVIEIAKGSFSAENVKLEVKEAYSIEQMVLAGLTTESDGKPLISGGMIYVNSVDKNVSINKPLNISIPTNYYDKKMQLYKGEEKDGKINWVDPQPLPAKDSLPPYLAAGKRLFEQNCATCHSLDRDLTGPRLSGTEGRGPWGNRSKLIAWTRDPAAFMTRSCYTQGLKKKYGAMMTGFPEFHERDINSIYDYIRNEDYQKGIVYNNNYNSACEDSCRRYDSVYAIVNHLNYKRDSLIGDNGQRINFDRTYSDSIIWGDTSDYIVTQWTGPDKVVPNVYQSTYYQFDIKTFDWYNVDQLVDNSGQQSELKVEMQGAHKDNMSVFIIVPQQRVFAEGGPLTGEENVYGFYTKDGKISLPAGSQVIVFAVGEADDQIFFDFKKFTSTDKQRIILEPKVVNKKEFNRTVKRFRLGDATIKVNDSKNAGDIRKTDKQIKKGQELLELYRPKNCDCGCGASDSTTTAIYETTK